MKSLKALLMGYSNTEYKTIDAEEAKLMMDNQEVIIIDVREENEYTRGHVPNSILIPLSTIKEENDILPEKEKTILVYCRSGSRSAKAAKILSHMGYKHIYNFGGILDWPYDIEK